MYIEASDQQTGERAILVTPGFTEGDYCVGFWYHMMGVSTVGMGTLSVYTSTLGDTAVWSQSGKYF